MLGLFLNVILLSVVVLFVLLVEVVDVGCYDSELGVVEVILVVGGLVYFWVVVFLLDNQGILVIEWFGSLCFVSFEGQLLVLLEGVFRVFVSGQGGLFDVVLLLGFVEDWLVYLIYVEVGEDGCVGMVVGCGWLLVDK